MIDNLSGYISFRIMKHDIRIWTRRRFIKKFSVKNQFQPIDVFIIVIPIAVTSGPNDKSLSLKMKDKIGLFYLKDIFFISIVEMSSKLCFLKIFCREIVTFSKECEKPSFTKAF